MPRIDPLIEKLFTMPGRQLVLETGQGAVLHTVSGPHGLVRSALTTEQILAALAEVAPPELHPVLPAPGPTTFTYPSPAGAVEIVVENRGGVVRAAVARPGEAGATTVEPTPARLPGERVTAVGATATVTELHPGRATAGAVTGDPRAAMEALLALMVERKASDLHLATGNVPTLRIDGDVRPLTDHPPMAAERLADLLWSITPARNREEWQASHDTDFAHENALGRFRGNVFSDRSGIGAVFRLIPNEILAAEDLGLAPPLLDLCFLTKGLVLVTGPTGSGKSTTLAALIDYVNRSRDDHIITIEDPIEFVHRNKRCIVNQREVGTHTDSFKRALRAALREDPDVILVGELRDLETIAMAIETAETGHLVFGTLHTNTAPSTVDRVIDQFPADRQGQIRQMLAESLRAVVSQTLCKRIGGGRVAAYEVLLCTSSVSNLIREGKTFQIPSIMQTARGVGMVTQADALLDLVKRKVVDPAEAYKRAVAKTEVKSNLERAGFRLSVPGEKPAGAPAAPVTAG